MWLRLRQICLVARALKPVEKNLNEVLGINVCFRDPGVGFFGLENALFPIGNQLLEVVAPVKEDTAGGRYLDRRGGDGGYMVITQCDNHASRRSRVEELGIRIAHQFDNEHFLNMQLHPKDTGATFFEIDEQLGEGAQDIDGPWGPAGPDWQRAKNTDRVDGILAAELQCGDSEAVAKKWSDIAEIPLDEELNLELDNASIRFIPCSDGRPEGLGGLDLSAPGKLEILQTADSLGLQTGDSQVQICGMRLNLL
tara:strand:- start:537 stop:1295 length:759 start_codon:yes stop_codon:yes gene_type:complete